MLRSDYRPLCDVVLPFADRQQYMHPFYLTNPIMAPGYFDYFRPVTDLCEAARAYTGIAYMTVDEKTIGAGAAQRRPGPHVDGCFIPTAKPSPLWYHVPEPLPYRPRGEWQHNNIATGTTPQRMSVIVASSVAGCRVWRGEFDGQPRSDGDLFHIRHLLGEGEVLPPNVGYLLSPDCVHESMVFGVNTKRTFLRIALPVDFDFWA